MTSTDYVRSTRPLRLPIQQAREVLFAVAAPMAHSVIVDYSALARQASVPIVSSCVKMVPVLTGETASTRQVETNFAPVTATPIATQGNCARGAIVSKTHLTVPKTPSALTIKSVIMAPARSNPQRDAKKTKNVETIRHVTTAPVSSQKEHVVPCVAAAPTARRATVP